MPKHFLFIGVYCLKMFTVSDFIMFSNSHTETCGQTDLWTWPMLCECSLCMVHRKHFTL